MAVIVAALAAVAMAGQTLQDSILEPSVTIKAGAGYGQGFGSGVVFTREGVNYILTAGHVVARLRTVQTKLKDGKEYKTEHFSDAQVIKVLYANNRKVGKLEMDAEVLAYSDPKDGHDLALLRVRKKGFIGTTAVFHPDSASLAIGTRIYHCGSLQGEMGSNSLTDGIISRTGRVHEGKVFDQSNATAFPGSSGGGIFSQDGRYVGMITRGAGETFNLYIPGRRMREWLTEAKFLWVIDPAVPMAKEQGGK
jgi:S1-C subfamily serine protease